MKSRYVLLGLLLAPAGLMAQTNELALEPRPVPLFNSDRVLEFTLATDLDALKKDRSQESEERPAQILLSDATLTTFDLKVRTRGNFRLRRSTCQMPPIRLNFPKSAVEGTVFHAQDKIKLVTHCRDGEAYEQNLLEEFIVYRIYNLLTDLSYQVRLVRITYNDTSGKNSSLTRLGFLIEDDDALAARVGGTMLDVPSIYPTQYDQNQMLLMTIFQYMVANTDWSMVQFHNLKLLRTGDMRHIPVPYDFDWTGLVNARYAEPNPTLGIRRVRDRLFRGFCIDGLDYASMFAYFQEKRPEITAMIQGLEELSEKGRKEAVEFIDEFYEVIENEGRANRAIMRACRPLT